MPTSPGRYNKVLALGLSPEPKTFECRESCGELGNDDESDFTNVEATDWHGKRKPPVGFPYGAVPVH